MLRMCFHALPALLPARQVAEASNTPFTKAGDEREMAAEASAKEARVRA